MQVSTNSGGSAYFIPDALQKLMKTLIGESHKLLLIVHNEKKTIYFKLQFQFLWGHEPYSKMAAILLFFCLLAN